MGNFEKLVVLTVLLAAAIVLAISLNRGADEAQASGPLSGAQQVLEQEGEPAESLPAAPAPQKEPSLLLNAGAESAPAPAAASGSASVALLPEDSALALDPVSDPERRILADTNGLRPSFLDDYMVYTVVEGDTWAGLAQRFYQDGRYTRNLHLANEDLTELVPGSEILVPVYDFVAVDAGLQPGGEALVAEQVPADQLPAEVQPGLPASTAGGAGAKPVEYVVQPGDTLSDISLAVFGTATRWKEIYDLNRDKLQKSEWLQVGMKLKIPAGGKLPASTPKKPEEKPKTAQASGTNAAPKKKKVL